MLATSSGCGGKPAPVLVRPKFDIPARPDRLPVQWTLNDGRYCTNAEGARNTAKNEDNATAHMDILEGYLRAGEGK
jgi:hypothetical protein